MSHIWVGKIVESKDLTDLTALAKQYQTAYCAAKDGTNYVAVNAGYHATMKDGQHADHNSYYAGHRRGNYTNYSKNSPVRSSNLVGNSGAS